MTPETWLEVPDEPAYSVSDRGNARKLLKSGRYRPLRCWLLSPRRPYRIVQVSGGKQRRLHRLIWAAFNGAIPEGMDVHHADGVLSNNRLENLALIEHAEHGRQSAIKRWGKRA
jgi:hypothetical protein